LFSIDTSWLDNEHHRIAISWKIAHLRGIFAKIVRSLSDWPGKSSPCEVDCVFRDSEMVKVSVSG
jgi:hypothetical protein